MNRTKIVEQVVTVVLSMVFTAFGGAVVWGVTTVIVHEKKLMEQKRTNDDLLKSLEEARQADKELVTMMAEEMRKLQEAVKKTCDHVESENDKNPLAEVFPWVKPEEKAKDEPRKKISEKFFPPEQRTDDYQRILRDKFQQRINNNNEQRRAPE